MTLMELSQPEVRSELAHSVAGVLADSYLLYNTTHAFHWNVEGPHFRALHLMFEEQYTELAAAVDELAERVRQLGFYAPWRLADMQRLASLEQPGPTTDAGQMVEHLIRCHEAVTERAREAVKVAQTHGDETTADLMIQRMNVHEKTAWMLRAMQGKGSESL